jgi:hypothetical protein
VPYNPAQATTTVTLATASVDLTVSPGPPWTAGQTVTLKATVKYDSIAWAGKTVSFTIIHVPTGHIYLITQVSTDSSGVAQTSYTIPWTILSDVLPCNTIGFRAAIDSPYVDKTVTGKCAYPTRISISVPSPTVPAGFPFTITGKLEAQIASGTWAPMSGRTVSVYYDSTKVGDVVTDGNGNYSINASISTTGTYTLKAVYAGEGFATAVAATTISNIGNIAIPIVLLVSGAIISTKLRK